MSKAVIFAAVTCYCVLLAMIFRTTWAGDPFAIFDGVYLVLTHFALPAVSLALLIGIRARPSPRHVHWLWTAFGAALILIATALHAALVAAAAASV